MPEIWISEEQNREWHRDNIRSCQEWIEQIMRQNEERLKEAEAELKEAIEWAKEDGVDV